MDNTVFRTNFPEFSDMTRYPDSMLSFWSAFATAMVNPCRWGTQTLMGIQLYVAHEITLQAASVQSAGNGGIPGQQSGPIANKTVGSVSVGYDAEVSSEKDAGYWNLTNYGKQFYRLVRLFGAGAIQL